MMKTFLLLLHYITVGITWLVALITLLGLYGGNVSPVSNDWGAVLCFMLPALLALNAVCLLYWVIRLRIWMVVPIGVFAACWGFISTQYQFDSRPDNLQQQEGITVATYNVQSFRHGEKKNLAPEILQTLQENGVDVVCMQEFEEMSRKKSQQVSTLYKEWFPYQTIGVGGQAIMSRYPIRKTEVIKFSVGNNTNTAMYADIDVGGKELRIYNVHFLTTGVNETRYQTREERKKDRVRQLMATWRKHVKQRATQAEELSNLMAVSDWKSAVVLCGDFNDTPYSYTYNRMADHLTDGFRSAGHGFMSTFNDLYGVLRIDFIFHNNQVTGLDYYTLPIEQSDHKPVFFKVKL